jgi:hypothetical protein
VRQIASEATTARFRLRAPATKFWVPLGAKVTAGTARLRPLRIFAIAHSRLNFMRAGTHMAVREVARVEYGNRDLHGLERPEPARR